MGFFFKNKESEKKSGPVAKVISFLNQKGGVGKTTMAFNTAHALASQGKKVLCLDMDPQSNLTLLFDGVKSEYNLFHLLLNSVRELKSLHVPVLFQDIIQTKNGVDIIAGSQEMSGFELTVAGISGARQLILKKFLEKSGISSLYDYIIIDGPPTLGLLVVNILCASQGLMIPFRPDEFSKVGLTHFYDVLENIEDMGVINPPEVLAHIPNLVDLRRKQEVSDLESIKALLQNEYGLDNVCEPFINRAPLVKSQSQKKSVFEYQSKDFSPLQDQFNDLAGIVNKWNEGKVYEQRQ